MKVRPYKIIMLLFFPIILYG